MDITNNWFNYLHTKRKLSRDIIKMSGLEVRNDLLQIPIYDIDGKLLFSKYRKAPWDTSNTAKYQYDCGGKVALYGIDHLNSGVIICEGELDCLALLTCGFNACSSTGGAMSFQKEWAPLFKDWIPTVMFDNDDTGIKGAVRTAFILKNVVFRGVPFNYGKDISDVLQNYGEEKVKEIMNSSNNCLIVSVPDLSLKKNMLEYRRILKEDLRKLPTGSIVQKFLWAMVVELTGMISAATQKRRKVVRPENNDEIVRARAYPIENLIKVDRWVATCPFHTNGQEKTPSLHIYQDNHAYCFGGCRKRFDAIDIAMAVHNMKFPEAVKFLNK